ncbi:asparagine--tRNA ligase [Mycoplasma mycoides subsp. capri]|uniref:asparagine--tRNA ligase n=1 Tax=Mycoplasma mycoides TaxID=2102 RepID=UPI00223FCEE9|nr:asparagine--tRNA ligase [Mycoplasma mycoides]QVJ96392.1 asparagine--tRNA ligase [Mycoplasma mycoides subsp. capri]QVJ97291.1 asparagine--tRNA ligase [Mycoplasma mycoides subsp. capri]QVK00275.1 asparagine--tRNA ligase [Mycoplasma mycoides subsp. capri]QVK01159.1 asparagine--tRNA ligase [Mycoplasma mycoides subsp. capri]
MEIRQIFEQHSELLDKEVEILGRVRSNRQGKFVSFMILNDGTTFTDLQVVYKTKTKGYEQALQARVSSIVKVIGRVVLTPEKQQKFELQADEIELIDQAIEDYPLQKKEHTTEYLREIAHLRAKTKTFNAIFKIRSAAAYAIHRFFNERNFVYIHSPIITSNDAEGAGEAFLVTTREDTDYEKDFFGKKASLTVSGQLHAEAFAQAFKKVYTFGPTFRAENSNTAKHAAEFWMIEPEVAFADLKDNIQLIQDMVKYIINYIFKHNRRELEFCNEHLENGLIDKLNNVRNSEFKITTYTQAIEILKQAVKDGHKFEVSDIEFGLDLGTEHERYICEQVNKAPTFVTNYPKEIKAFYMKQNDDNKTVAAVDLLVPGIGELVGGSQREDNYEKLIKRCKEVNIDIDQLEWYNNLRLYGYYKSAGFGLGFERLVMYITGASNIRDVIPFPRTPKNLLF